MVYETRRVYSSRPIVTTTSYSPMTILSSNRSDIPPTVVRRMAYGPVVKKGRKLVKSILSLPRIVHQRMTTPARTTYKNYYEPLEYSNGYNRMVLVRYRTSSPSPVRSSTVSYIEDVTNEGREDIAASTRSIQNDLDYMLYRVSAGLTPRANSPYSINSIPMRSATEVKEIADMRRLHVRDRNPGLFFAPFNKLEQIYRSPIIHYPDPLVFDPKWYFEGRQSALACLTYDASGRPIPKRTRFYYTDPEQDRKITFRSFYSKLRNMAGSTRPPRGYARSTLYQPIYYSRKTILGDKGEKREPKESKWVEKVMKGEPKTPVTPIKRPSVKAPEARRESLTKDKVPDVSQRQINVTLPGPRKSITEIVGVEKLRDVETSVTVRRPSRMEEEEPAKVEAAEATVVVKKKKEPSPPPKEPTPPPKEPTPPPKEPTPPPKEPTPPPPKEPTPPPKEPTPPPKEPTPPPKEPTPPPKEPTPPPAVVEPPSEPPAVPEPEPNIPPTPEPANNHDDKSDIGEPVGSEKGDEEIAEIQDEEVVEAVKEAGEEATVEKEEIAQEEVAQEEPALDETAQEEIAADEPAQDEIAADEPAQDEPAQGEPAQDERAKAELAITAGEEEENHEENEKATEEIIEQLDNQTDELNGNQEEKIPEEEESKPEQNGDIEQDQEEQQIEESIADNNIIIDGGGDGLITDIKRHESIVEVDHDQAPPNNNNER